MTQGSDLPGGIAMSNGRLAAERIEIATKLVVRVAEVRVSEGNWVADGTLLVRVDTTETEALLRQEQAEVLEARQQAIQADARSRQRRSELTPAETEDARVLLHATGLDPFSNRPAGKLSGGLKQKLSLCSARPDNVDG